MGFAFMWGPSPSVLFSRAQAQGVVSRAFRGPHVLEGRSSGLRPIVGSCGVGAPATLANAFKIEFCDAEAPMDGDATGPDWIQF